MTKKLIVLTICFVFLLGLVGVAENDVNLQMEAGEFLRDIQIYRGYPDGSLGLDQPITRAEFATTMVRIVGTQNLSNENLQNINFRDVKPTHWAYADISIAAANRWVEGYTEDNTFRPSGNITYAEALTILVRVLGYEDEVTEQWPSSHIKMADTLGITKYLSPSPKQVLNRGEVAVLLREALFVQLKN